jgi:hypothetical protein
MVLILAYFIKLLVVGLSYHKHCTLETPNALCLLLSLFMLKVATDIQVSTKDVAVILTGFVLGRLFVGFFLNAMIFYECIWF